MTTTTLAPVTIRLAAPEHLPEVHRMLIALAACQHEDPTITPNALRRIAMQGPGARLLVATLDDSPLRHPVGYALMMLKTDMLSGKHGYEIVQLFVQEPLRRQGIGRALIQGAKILANNEGRSRLVIGSHPANQAANLVYEAMGLSALPPAAPRYEVSLA